MNEADEDHARRSAAPEASPSSTMLQPIDYVALQRSGDIERAARDRLVHEDGLREEDQAGI